MSLSPDELTTSYDFKDYAAVSGDIDLVAEFGRPCRWIYCAEPGDLIMEDRHGNEVKAVAVAGANIICSPVVIKSASTVTNILVCW